MFFCSRKEKIFPRKGFHFHIFIPNFQARIASIGPPIEAMLFKKVWKRKSARRKEPFLKRFFLLASNQHNQHSYPYFFHIRNHRTETLLPVKIGGEKTDIKKRDFEPEEIPYSKSRCFQIWSEHRDSNPGLSGPKPDALPDCAMLRNHVVNISAEPRISSALCKFHSAGETDREWKNFPSRYSMTEYAPKRVSDPQDVSPRPLESRSKNGV